MGAPSEWRRRDSSSSRLGACVVLSKSPTGHTQGTQLHPRGRATIQQTLLPSLSSRRRSLDRAGSWFSLRARTATLRSVSRLSPLTYRFLRYAPATLSHTLIAQTSLAPVARPTPPGTIKQQKCTTDLTSDESHKDPQSVSSPRHHLFFFFFSNVLSLLSLSVSMTVIIKHHKAPNSIAAGRRCCSHRRRRASHAHKSHIDTLNRSKDKFVTLLPPPPHHTKRSITSTGRAAASTS